MTDVFWGFLGFGLFFFLLLSGVGVAEYLDKAHLHREPKEKKE